MNKSPKELAEIYRKAAFDRVIILKKTEGGYDLKGRPLSPEGVIGRVGVGDTMYVDSEGTLWLRDTYGNLRRCFIDSDSIFDKLNAKLVQRAQERATLGYDPELVNVAKSYAEQMEPSEREEFLKDLEEGIEGRVWKVTNHRDGLFVGTFDRERKETRKKLAQYTVVGNK